jgi:GTP-binding protein
MGKRNPPTIAIVGRPNVGKSTLFNRILRRRDAVVHDTPGVTRDRHSALATWEGRTFLLVDTGGLLLDSEGIIESQVRAQVEAALLESQHVLFVVDGRAGLVADDYEVAAHLRKRSARATLVVTKVETSGLEIPAHEFAELGLTDMHFVSGLEGRGIAELLDAVCTALPADSIVPESDDPHIAVIGRPNVGKSSIVNALLQRDRMIVSDTPGTTRDAIDTAFRHEGKGYVLIDTAGLRRKAKIESGIEYFSALRTTRSVERADVVVVVLDASEPISRQDFRIAAMPFEAGLPVVFVFNKWDLVPEKQTLSSRDIVREAARHVGDFAHAPCLFVSADTAQRVSRIMQAVVDVLRENERRVTDDEAEALIREITGRRSHPYVGGHPLKFFSMRQVDVAPPTFIVYCSRPEQVEAGYQRFIRNRVREAFGFIGAPIRLLFRRR